MTKETKLYIDTAYSSAKGVTFHIQVRSENPDAMHSPNVIDLKKGDSDACTITVREAEFLRDWLNMVLGKHLTF